MKFMHCIPVAMIVACTCLPASAQWKVIDVKQAVLQVASWKTQSEQMIKSLSQTKQTLESMTGVRSMSSVLNGARTFLPNDINQALTTLTPRGANIRSAQAVLTADQLAQLPASARAFMENSRILSAAHQSMAQDAYNDAVERQSRLNTLGAERAKVIDMKGAADLANAIAIENAALQKDHIQLVAAANNMTAQAAAQENMINEMRAASAGTGNFPQISTALPW